MGENNKFYLEYFSKKLKGLIKKNNVKNIDLANYLGLSKGAISNYISGKYSPPKIDVLYKIAEYFNVSLYELLGDDPLGREHVSEKNSFAYELPLFNNVLISDKLMYNNANYLGTITSPIPVNDDLECYAVIVKDDFMKGFGISKSSCVIFSAATEVADGEIAAVLIKSKKEIFIRSVSYENEKIILTSDEGTEAYNKNDIFVLGKVYCATFYPNK